MISLRRAPVTAGLLVAIAMVFALEVVTGANHDVYELVNLGAIMHGVFEHGTPWSGEYWRLFAAMFLHGGFLHLFLNMWALYQLGMIFETMFGSGRFFATYFVSGICASIASTTFIPDNTPGVGASGAIFGVLGALILAIRRSPRWSRHDWSAALSRQLLVWAGINIVIGFTIPGIDNAAHLGGLAAGLLLGLIPHRVPPPPPSEMIIDVSRDA